jgi:hypothetical protein
VIVISGALVLVALVLLVLGLTMTDLNFVYGSIAVSLISFVFLVIGILQRRGEQPAVAGADGPAVSDDTPEAVPATTPAKTGGPGPVPVVSAADDAGADEDLFEDEIGPAGATVLVVPGRPRYHVEGCRYLAGKAVEELDAADARAQYSPCGVCKPDVALAALAVEAEVEPTGAEPDEGPFEEYDEEPADIFADVPDEELAPESADADTAVHGGVDEPVPVAARRTTSRRAAAPAKAPSRARKAPAKSARSGSARTRKVAAPAVVPVAVDAPPAAVPAPTKAAPRPRKVVIIPDRGRFHTRDCRFVRDIPGTEEVTRTQATRQGFQPCGVCKP